MDEQRSEETEFSQTNMDQSTGSAGQSLAQERVDDPVRTPFEQVMDTARGHTSMAADALRRGEFVQDENVDANANNDDRLIALLAYASQIFVPLIMPVIVLLSASSKTRPFQRYHAVQALALSVLFLAMGMIFVIAMVVVQIVPLLGALLALAMACLTPIAFLMYVTAMFYYGYQAYQGKRFAIPGLTAFLHDQGWIAE